MSLQVNTMAFPGPSCGGVAYWIFCDVIPGWDICVAGDEDWIWGSECSCCSSASLVSGQAIFS